MDCQFFILCFVASNVCCALGGRLFFSFSFSFFLFFMHNLNVKMPLVLFFVFVVFFFPLAVHQSWKEEVEAFLKGTGPPRPLTLTLLFFSF